jgi:hypothetical protein
MASQSNQGIEGIANKFELSVINKYSTKLSMVCFIETNSDDNSLWIGTGSSRKLFYFSAPKDLRRIPHSPIMTLELSLVMCTNVGCKAGSTLYLESSSIPVLLLICFSLGPSEHSYNTIRQHYSVVL